jgi:hypothetical protein
MSRWILLGVALTGCMKLLPSDERNQADPPTESEPPPETDSAEPPDEPGDDDGTPPPPEDTGPVDPMDVDCTVREGITDAAGLIEGSPIRLNSAAWYADPSSGAAWVLLSPQYDACSQIDAYDRNDHSDRAIVIWMSDWEVGTSVTMSVIPEPEIVPGDGTAEAMATGWEPDLNLPVLMDHGQLVVRESESEGTLKVTGFDTWSEYGDTMEGSFSACWCPAVQSFRWPIIEDSSPPAPPPVTRN